MKEDLRARIRGLLVVVVVGIIGAGIIGVGVGWPAKTCTSAEVTGGGATAPSATQCTSTGLIGQATAALIILLGIALITWAVFRLFSVEITRIVAALRNQLSS